MIEKKKILFIAEMLAGRGGMENVTRQVILQLNADPEYSAGLFLLDSDCEFSASSWREGIVWGQSKRITRNPKITRLMHAVMLALFIAKHKPDHVIAMNTIPCLIARRAITLSRVKTVLSTWMHLPPNGRYRPRYLMRADHHFAISRDIANQLVALGAAPESIDVVFNPVRKVATVIKRPESLKMLYLGRIHFTGQKNLKDLLDAASKLTTTWSLDILGDGEGYARCLAYADSLGIAQHITWHGWQDNSWDYIEKNIKEVTCLVLTSSMEGLPLVLLEAIARGIYCVSSDCVSGPSDIIKDGINGQLYETYNVDELVSILDAPDFCKTLPDQEIVKDSIHDFYEDAYMTNFKNILQQRKQGTL